FYQLENGRCVVHALQGSTSRHSCFPLLNLGHFLCVAGIARAGKCAYDLLVVEWSLSQSERHSSLTLQIVFRGCFHVSDGLPSSVFRNSRNFKFDCSRSAAPPCSAE